MKSKLKKNKLYLSDKQPLSFVGKIMLFLSYVVLIAWSIAILWPLSDMIISAFNGLQQKNLRLNTDFAFSLKHFDYLFN